MRCKTAISCFIASAGTKKMTADFLSLTRMTPISTPIRAIGPGPLMSKSEKMFEDHKRTKTDTDRGLCPVSRDQPQQQRAASGPGNLRRGGEFEHAAAGLRHSRGP